MRSDMGKVVVERQRIGSKNPNIKSRMKFRGENVDYDKVDESVSTKKIGHKTLRAHQIGYDKKGFNEHLNPLKKFILTNCGRPWDKVFSEISKTVPVNSVLGHHIIKDHLFQYVERNTFEKNGDIFVFDNSRIYNVKDVHAFPFGAVAYVHPATGILTKFSYPKKRDYTLPNDNEKELNFIKVSDELEYRKENGIWFSYSYRYDPGDTFVYYSSINRYYHKQPDGSYATTYKSSYIPEKNVPGFQHWKLIWNGKKTLSKKVIKTIKPEDCGNYDHYKRIRKFIPSKNY